MAQLEWSAGAITTLMTTELNSLGNATGAIASSGYDNSSNLYTYAVFELNVTWGSAPTAGNTVDLYFIVAPDGTNYDDNWNNPPAFAGSFAPQASASAQKMSLGLGYRGLIYIPPLKIEARIYNNSGVAMPASGNTLKMVPFRYQTV